MAVGIRGWDTRSTAIAKIPKRGCNISPCPCIAKAPKASQENRSLRSGQVAYPNALTTTLVAVRHRLTHVELHENDGSSCLCACSKLLAAGFIVIRIRVKRFHASAHTCSHATGKTSLIKRYVDGSFDSEYKLSIGVDFSLKNLTIDDQPIALQLWDIAGHERYRSMTSTYYRYAMAAVLVFDLSRPATFDSIVKWHTDLNDKVMLANGDRVPAILIANKADSILGPIDEAMLDEYCSKHGFLGWFATSAKTGQNIGEAFETLAREVIRVANEAGTTSKDPSSLNVRGDGQEQWPAKRLEVSCCSS
ncbi:uncharacterized protein MONBRDRAFT_38928 [Monosiga brevicollis MX1]|uniref:Ras-related protein Rab n=1 Tax=Monosiga brevicollis TaxID=81824 RepID=A9VB09_MONBE|nr:uncharacterized protein MONBRDRAFT_38928 [Monosiga brevicollis MX1]EDQ85310.1 predicted protein [Monosiga brevicollis MX1]|eukprot:XP_001749931.1 hypothetical protein [Monosiga brevicollis MX1]